MLEIRKGTPEETGIPSGAILSFLKRLDRNHIPMHSVLLMRRNKLIFEGYYAPCRKGELHRMFSVSKSFTSLAIAKLAEEGKLSLQDPIVQHFPEYDSGELHPWVKQTTIQNMLEMRTCHAGTTYKKNLDRDWVESFFIVPPDHKPGTVFHYDTSSSHTLCALVEKLAGKSMLDYLKDTMLREIGFSEESYMVKDPFGVSMGGSGLMATSEDFLRVGILLMQEGEIDGKQLVSREYIREATACRVENMVKGPVLSESQGYGYQFWCGTDGSYMCYGMGGQLIICMPKQELLCVTTADTQGIGGGTQIIHTCLAEEILPCLSDVPLEENQAAYGELLEYAKKLCIPPLSVCRGKERIDARSREISGKEYVIQESFKGFEKMCLELEESGEGTFTFVLKGETYRFRFGYDSVAEGRFPIHDMKCAASGMWLDENTFYIRVFLLGEACGSIHIQLYFGENDLTVFMKKDDEMLYKEFTGHLYGQMVQ